MRYWLDRPEYDDPTKCHEMFHHELRNGPYCREPINHDGKHSGNALQWDKEPDVDKETAKKFIDYYRRIPNSNHEIWLNDDGTVGMTLRAFWAATKFIGVSASSDY